MKRDIFNVDTSLISYTYPIVKIIISLVLIVLVTMRDHIIHTNNIIFHILSVVVGIMCIRCIMIAVCEFDFIRDNREEMRVALEKAWKKYTINKIVSMAKENEIIEIKIIVNGKIIKIGSSSDSSPGISELFDKRYYVGKKEFLNIEDFKEAITLYSEKGKLNVYSIDDILQK